MFYIKKKLIRMEGCCPGRVDHTSKGSGNDGSCVNYICHKTDHHPLDSRN